MPEPTREQKTESEYLKRAQGRLGAYLEASGMDWDLHQEGFIAWLEEYRETISKASWRQNRAALVWYMKEVVSEPELAGAIVDIGTFACTDPSRTSSKKKKSLSVDDNEALTDALLASHERHLKNGGKLEESIAMNTLLFLVASEITGLRPSEWWGSTLYEAGDIGIDGEVVDLLTLIVKNGKATNGRAHGESRTLRFNDLTEEKEFALLTHYRSVKRLESEEAFESYYKACKNRMSYTTKKLWPKRKRIPTLYSGRHQFSANLKKANTPLKILAALMGHGSDATATSHYGKKRYGRGNETGVEADMGEVERIREMAKPAYGANESHQPTAIKPK